MPALSPGIFHFYNLYHLGDNILNLKFLFNISSLLKSNNIFIYYYYDDNYKYNSTIEMNKYLDPSVVSLRPLSQRPSNAIELWMDNEINGINFLQVDTYFNLFYKKILQYLNLDNTNINTSVWQKEPYLNSVYNTLDKKYTDIDIFIINNKGQSLQYSDNEPLNNLAKYLNTKFNIVVTNFIDDSIKYTTNLTVQEYGAISSHSKYVICVWSGSSVGCYNSYSKIYVKKWFFLGNLWGKQPIHAEVNSESLNNEHIHKIKTYFDNVYRTQNKSPGLLKNLRVLEGGRKGIWGNKNPMRN
jgi:hypothetical protein